MLPLSLPTSTIRYYLGLTFLFDNVLKFLIFGNQLKTNIARLSIMTQILIGISVNI